jgi:hypothetical protein
MIVVALIAIIAAIAVYIATRRIGDAKTAEVGGMLGELHLRERAYPIEHNGQFLSTGGNETDMWPAGVPGNSARDIAPIPATWQELNIKSPKGSLYCSYVAIAGPANDNSNVGAKAAEFAFSAPAANWYYLLAQCNFDHDSSVDNFHFSSSVNSLVNEQNHGK